MSENLTIILIIITGIYGIIQFMVLIGFVRQKNRPYPSPTTPPLKISVIIPVRNEETYIEACVQSLLHQNYKHEDYEIIIVNDHSTDQTIPLLTAMTSPLIRALHLKDKSGKKEALRYGIKKAQHDIIVTTDADCQAPVDWLKTIAATLNEDADMLLGPISFKSEVGFLNAFQQLDMMAMQAAEFGGLHFYQPILNNAANLSFKKDKYLQVKGYDNYKTPSGDDVFLLEKFNANQFLITGVLKNDFVVETAPTHKTKELLNQRVRWASKSKFYQNKILIFYALTIVFQNLIQLFIYYHVLFIEKFRMIYIILLLTKWLIDFILLFLVATFFKRKSALLYFIPVQLIYPFYIMGVSIASTFMKYEWKGRKY